MAEQPGNQTPNTPDVRGTEVRDRPVRDRRQEPATAEVPNTADVATEPVREVITVPDPAADAADDTDAAAGGMAADETIGTAAGDETIGTAAGDETIGTAAGDETVGTAAGDETVDTAAGDETVDTAAGDETVDTAAGDETIGTAAGDETVDTAAGDETVDTAAGDETVGTAAGSSTVSGGETDDAADSAAGDEVRGEVDSTDTAEAGDVPGSDSDDMGAGPDGGRIRTGEETSKSLKYSQEITSPEDEPERQGRSLATTHHEVIKQWAEERGGTPATVDGTEHGDHLGVLRFDFGGDNKNLRQVSWEEWFDTFDARRLNFIYQEQRRDGHQSNFFRLESPDREDG